MWKALVLSAAAVLAVLGGAGGAVAQVSPSSSRSGAEIDGTITKVDAEKRVIHVDTSEGTLVVRFLTDVPDLHPGDKVTLHRSPPREPASD